MCPSHLHEVDETSSGFSEGEGNQTNHVSGRPAVPVQLSEYPTQPNGVCQGLISYVGSDHRQEIPNGTGAGDSISGYGSINISNASDTIPKEKMAHIQQEASNCIQRERHQYRRLQPL